MDLSLASYKFSALNRQSIIHCPPFLGPLPLVNYYDLAFGPSFWSYKLALAFGPLNSPSLESNTKRKTLVAQGRVKLCDPLYVEWNRSQDLTLTLYRLSSP